MYRFTAQIESFARGGLIHYSSLNLFFLIFILFSQVSTFAAHQCHGLFQEKELNSVVGDLVLRAHQGRIQYVTLRTPSIFIPTLSTNFLNLRTSQMVQHSYINSLLALQERDVYLNLGAGDFIDGHIYRSSTPWQDLNYYNRNFRNNLSFRNGYGDIDDEIFKITQEMARYERDGWFEDPKNRVQDFNSKVFNYVLGLQSFFKKPLQNRPTIVGVSYENLFPTKGPSLNLENLEKIHYLQGRLFKDIPNKELKSYGTIRLILDYYGVATYTFHHDLYLLKLAEILTENGEAFIYTTDKYRVLEEVVSESQALNSISKKQGQFFWRWMATHSQGLDISIAYEGLGGSLVHVLRTREPLKIPKLQLLARQTEDTPYAAYAPTGKLLLGAE